MADSGKSLARRRKPTDEIDINPAQYKSRSALFHIYTMLLFVYADFKIIVIPQTVVGCSQALAASLIHASLPVTAYAVAQRVPLMILWNTVTTMAFNVANQRLPASILEDTINKPWRPLPSKRLSANEAHQLLFALLVAGLALGQSLGCLMPTMALFVMTWMYNDLHGGDHWLLRNGINAVAFGVYGAGSTIIAAMGGFWRANQVPEFTPTGFAWIGLMSLVVLTTLQVQDLPDMEGDLARGRSTIPLVFGEQAGRFSVALFVLLWSILCPGFWGFGNVWCAYLVGLLGSVVAFRSLFYRTVESDDKTYKTWCLWLTILYILPSVHQSSAFVF